MMLPLLPNKSKLQRYAETSTSTAKKTRFSEQKNENIDSLSVEVKSEFDLLNEDVKIEDDIMDQPYEFDSRNFSEEHEKQQNLIDHDYAKVNTSKEQISSRQDIMFSTTRIMFPVRVQSGSSPTLTSNQTPSRTMTEPEPKLLKSVPIENKNCEEKLNVHFDHTYFSNSERSCDSLEKQNMLLDSCESPVILKKIHPKEVPASVRKAYKLMRSQQSLLKSNINRLVLEEKTSKIDLEKNSVLLTKVHPWEISTLNEEASEINSISNVNPDSTMKPGKFKNNDLIVKSKTSKTGLVETHDTKINNPVKKTTSDILASQKFEESPVTEFHTKGFFEKPHPKHPDEIRTTKSYGIIDLTLEENHTSLTPKNINKISKSSQISQYFSNFRCKSQVSTTGSTCRNMLVSKQRTATPSTPSISETQDHFVETNMTSPFMNLQNNLCDDDEGCPEDLGLSSMEELEQFWELLLELYHYNCNTIKILLKRKKSYKRYIKRLKHHIIHELDLGVEDHSNQEDVLPVEESQLISEEKDNPTEANENKAKEE